MVIIARRCCVRRHDRVPLLKIRNAVAIDKLTRRVPFRGPAEIQGSWRQFYPKPTCSNVVGQVPLIDLPRRIRLAPAQGAVSSPRAASGVGDLSQTRRCSFPLFEAVSRHRSVAAVVTIVLRDRGPKAPRYQGDGGVAGPRGRGVPVSAGLGGVLCRKPVAAAPPPVTSSQPDRSSNCAEVRKEPFSTQLIGHAWR